MHSAGARGGEGVGPRACPRSHAGTRARARAEGGRTVVGDVRRLVELGLELVGAAERSHDARRGAHARHRGLRFGVAVGDAVEDVEDDRGAVQRGHLVGANGSLTQRPGCGCVSSAVCAFGRHASLGEEKFRLADADADTRQAHA